MSIVPTKKQLTLLIGNAADHRQVRWADAVIPTWAADAIPDQGMTATGMLYQKGGSRPCGVTVHCLADVPADAVVRHDLATAKPFKLPRAFSKLVPQPQDLGLELVAGQSRFPMTIISGQGGAEQHRVRFEFRGAGAGFVAELWADVYSYQDPIPVCGCITWSDRKNPAAWSMLAGQQVYLQVAQGRFHLDFSTPWGTRNGGFTIQPLESGQAWPDAMSFPFYGSWLPNVSDAAMDDPDSKDTGPFWALRIDTLIAAEKGPLYALFENWDGSWFATGTAPPVVPGAQTGSENYLAWKQTRDRVPGKIHDQRPWASPKSTGQTGDQWVFAMAHDYWLTRGNDPRRIRVLQDSCVDYLLRCHHNSEGDGRPVRFSEHPSLRTWNLKWFFTGSDKLGKTESPSAFGRDIVDDQHRGDAGIAALRHVTDDPLLDRDLFDRTQMDLARAKRHFGGPDAPRAGGRLLQSWAMGWWTTGNKETQEALHRLSLDEFALWEGKTYTPTGVMSWASGGPVRPASVISTDTRVIDGGPAWMPWQEAILVAGVWHQYCLWSGPGADKAFADRLFGYALTMCETLLRYALVDVGGTWFPLNGVLWRPNGEANPESYYAFPRGGASFGDDAWDMLVGTPGWFKTFGWPVVARIYQLHGKDQGLRTRAHAVMASATSQLDLKTSSWLAV